MKTWTSAARAEKAWEELERVKAQLVPVSHEVFGDGGHIREAVHHAEYPKYSSLVDEHIRWLYIYNVAKGVCDPRRFPRLKIRRFPRLPIRRFPRTRR